MDKEAISSFEQLDTLLAQGKISEDEYHDLWNALKGKRTAEQPARATETEVGDEAGRLSLKTPLSSREIAVIVLCAFFQVLGLVCIIAGVPIVPAVAGFAAIVQYILTPSDWRFVKRVTLIGAFCGGGIIILSLLAHA